MTKKKQSTEAAVREIRRRTRRKFAPEEKVRGEISSPSFTASYPVSMASDERLAESYSAATENRITGASSSTW
jgi:hypothetical protein